MKSNEEIDKIVEKPTVTLGEKQMMFKYVKDYKYRRMALYNEPKEQVDEDFEFVSDNDVIIY